MYSETNEEPRQTRNYLSRHCIQINQRLLRNVISPVSFSPFSFSSIYTFSGSRYTRGNDEFSVGTRSRIQVDLRVNQNSNPERAYDSTSSRLLVALLPRQEALVIETDGNGSDSLPFLERDQLPRLCPTFSCGFLPLSIVRKEFFLAFPSFVPSSFKGWLPLWLLAARCKVNSADGIEFDISLLMRVNLSFVTAYKICTKRNFVIDRCRVDGEIRSVFNGRNSIDRILLAPCIDEW